MKKLITIITLYVIIIFLSIAFFNYILFNNPKKNYISAFINKLTLLKKYKNTRKIVLIGGSSVGFGISAKMIENEIGIKTINLGLHYGIGLTDYIEFLMNNLNKDDIIIFSPEWIFYSDPLYKQNQVLINLYKNNEYGKLLNNNYYQFLGFLPKFNLNFFRNIKYDSVYNYNCLNENGDIISHIGLQNRSISAYSINKKNSVIKFSRIFPYLKTNRVIFIFPPTQINIYKKYRISLDSIYSSLKINNYEVLNSVEDNIYPDSSFFDTQYHLNNINRIKRTKTIINYLKNKNY